MKTTILQKQNIGKGNFIKYLNPSTLIQPKNLRNKTENSNIHCRSMEELDINLNKPSNSSITKEYINNGIHHSSLFSDKNSFKADQQSGKSRSLSKFITFFQNSNLLGSNQTKKQLKDLKKTNYNGFSYDLKFSSNLNVANKKVLKKKDKENVNYQTSGSQRPLQILNLNKSTLITRNQNRSPGKNTANQSQELLLVKMKEVIEQQKHRQAKYCQKIDELEERNKVLLDDKYRLQNQIQTLSNLISQCEQKVQDLQVKNKQIQQRNKSIKIKQERKLNKENREQNRQHEIVIKSLKKVINQQLNKIIELERVKIQNQYLKQKLAESLSSQFSPSRQEIIFDYEDLPKKKNSPTSLSSSFKSGTHQKFNLENENFDKSKPKKQQLQQKNQSFNRNHFKSFFQIQSNSISPDDNMKQFFIKSEPKQQNLKDFSKNQEPSMIKIVEAQSSFSHEAIEQVNEQNHQAELIESKLSMKKIKKSENTGEGSQTKVSEDSILQQVDQYLSRWRGKV